MNKEAIKRSIVGAIAKEPTLLKIKRPKLDKHKQPDGEDPVTEVNGFYHRENKHRSINISINEGGQVKSDINEKMMVVLDEEGQKIKEGDFFFVKEQRYDIVDLGNVYDIYNDMTIKRG